MDAINYEVPREADDQVPPVMNVEIFNIVIYPYVLIFMQSRSNSLVFGLFNFRHGCKDSYVVL